MSIKGKGQKVCRCRRCLRGEPPAGQLSARSSDDFAINQTSKHGAFKAIINSDHSRRALIKYLDSKKLTTFLDFYFEIEYVKTLEGEMLWQNLDRVRERYLSKYFTLDCRIEAMIEICDEVYDDPADETPGEHPAYQKITAAHDEIFDYLANEIDSFRESEFYKMNEKELLQKEFQSKESAYVKPKVAVANLSTIVPSRVKREILLFDDSGVARKVTAKLLEQGPFNVTAVAHPRKDLTEINYSKLDIVVVDMFMPIMSGFEVVKAIRKTEQEMERSPGGSTKAAGSNSRKGMFYGQPITARSARSRALIVGMSGDACASTRKRSLAAGADTFLQKPFTLQQFMEEITHCELQVCPSARKGTISLNTIVPMLPPDALKDSASVGAGTVNMSMNTASGRTGGGSTGTKDRDRDRDRVGEGEGEREGDISPAARAGAVIATTSAEGSESPEPEPETEAEPAPGSPTRVNEDGYDHDQIMHNDVHKSAEDDINPIQQSASRHHRGDHDDDYDEVGKHGLRDEPKRKSGGKKQEPVPTTKQPTSGGREDADSREPFPHRHTDHADYPSYLDYPSGDPLPLLLPKRSFGAAALGAVEGEQKEADGEDADAFEDDRRGREQAQAQSRSTHTEHAY
jgi:CheY-like chemotaxis protein